MIVRKVSLQVCEPSLLYPYSYTYIYVQEILCTETLIHWPQIQENPFHESKNLCQETFVLFVQILSTY